jgi:hypothetical protein
MSVLSEVVPAEHISHIQFVLLNRTTRLPSATWLVPTIESFRDVIYTVSLSTSMAYCLYPHPLILFLSRVGILVAEVVQLLRDYNRTRDDRAM